MQRLVFRYCNINLFYMCTVCNFGLSFVHVDPPAITTIEIAEVCINDFTVSCTAASNEEGLSYVVTLLPPSGGVIGADLMMDTSYNFTDLFPDATYNVTVASRSRSTSCVGIPNTIMVTTLTVAEGIPASELPCKAKYSRGCSFRPYC